MECYQIWNGTTNGADLLGKLQEQVFRVVDSQHAASLELLAQSQNVPFKSLLHRDHFSALTLEDVNLKWLNFVLFLFLSEGPIITVMGCMIFLSSSPHFISYLLSKHN